jgi:TldD protein
VSAVVAAAADALPTEDPLSHVFFEERTDRRTTLTSSGFRDVIESRRRGAAISGRRSLHLAEPDFMDGVTTVPEGGGQWVAALEDTVVAAGTSASSGRRHPNWLVKLVSFHQHVWVGLVGGEVVHDVRRGATLEIRVQAEDPRKTPSVEELVLEPSRPASVTEAFVRAFDRAETRWSVVSPPKSGPSTAVLAAGVAGVVVHELIGHALEGDALARGPTWIRAEDFPEAARPVTVIDDPRRGRGAWTLDDEGTAAQETPLIERGRPVGMLLDRSSAITLGRPSTGHGRRTSFLETVLPRMGCTFIGAGDDDPSEALRTTRTGVYIRRLTAGHTDRISGRASFLVTDADRIIDGRLAEPLDAFVLELDGRESWRSIDRVGHDLAFDRCIGSCMRDGQPLAVSVGAPTIRIGVTRVHS